MHHQSTGSGPPLLLLHGFTGSMQNWEPLIPHLADSNTVITVDLPGHGQSLSPANLEPYTMAVVASELINLMDRLGYSSFNLVGYSMGGRLALFMAANHPDQVKKLILESASPGLRTAAERQERIKSDHALADRIERGGIESFVNFWESISLWESQEQLPALARDKLRQLRLLNSPAGLANSLKGMGTGQQPSLWPNLKDINQDALLLTGQLDIKFCAIMEEMQSLMPKAKHHVIVKAGHTIHIEQPEAWLEAVLKFLTDS
ncbi:MAG: 2-succinyl-6-hydroxy-2,4-cyclohexadiene-1-carboxylate synthase [Chloroflexota bacterium]